jgi:hypothetical protein
VGSARNSELIIALPDLPRRNAPIACRFQFVQYQGHSHHHMPTAKNKSRQARAEEKPEDWNDPQAVDEYLSKLKHPLKPVVEAIRSAILSADSQITEGIKWNAPSFYRNGWFATANVRGKDSVLIVFHVGAKVKDNSTAGMTIDDSAGLLEWVAKERAIARFRDLEDVNAKRNAFKAVVNQWIRQKG